MTKTGKHGILCVRSCSAGRGAYTRRVTQRTDVGTIETNQHFRKKNMTTKKLAVEKRDVVGSGKLNALRAKGWVPGVVYGPAAGENINVQMKAADLRVLLGDDETDTILVSLQLEGKALLTLIKHVQHNHLKDTTTHVDFLAVTPDTMVLTEVPVHLKGTPVGVSMGGQVQQLVHDLPVRSAVKDIPTEIVADITNISLDESLRLSQITLPERVTTPFNGTVVLVSVVKP